MRSIFLTLALSLLAVPAFADTACEPTIEQLLAAPAVCSAPQPESAATLPEILRPSATPHCCSQLEVDACRRQECLQGCKPQVGCTAGECVCRCVCR